MPLERYHAKRDFDKTAEPRGRQGNKAAGRLAFVIQKHDASRLHFDFRLEYAGVLKSWAVPKGPSTDPSDKRLAVEVEDHPLDYGDFEGTIPAGNYGGGTVMLWDRGWWEPTIDPEHGFAKGHLQFKLHGTRLTGEWSLVRMARKRQTERQQNWLLIKADDDAATHGSGPGAAAEAIESVASGRTMAAIADAQPPAPARKSRAGKGKSRTASALPDHVTPMLATLADKAPEGDQWLHEIKYDGYRILARIDQGATTLVSRNGLDWTSKFPEIAASLAKLGATNAILDGEIVFHDQDGRSDFGALQDALSRQDTGSLAYMVFDLPALDGEDLRARPVEYRKARLASLVADLGDERLRYNDHRVGDGARFLAEACKLGLEGIVSKRLGSPYRAGRGPDWRKAKCGRRDDFLIVGFTEPAGARRGFGALLLASADGTGALVYAGRVGTGFSDRFLGAFGTSLAAIERRDPTVTLPSGVSGSKTHWVEPRYLAEVGFAERTRDGLLRQAKFLGLRDDKTLPDAASAEPPPDSKPGKPNRGQEIVNHTRITHPDRVLYPADGVTKLALAEYYAAAADRLLPRLVDRPLSMLRCPGGIGGDCFFQKHLRSGVPDSVERIEIVEGHGPETYLVIKDLDGVLGLVQMGVIEFHPWGSTVQNLEQPDQLIFDLDPAEDVPWDRVTEAALAVRDLLDALGLKSFAKTSGGKGLHVVTPITPDLHWDRAKAFSRAVAEYLARELPERYVATVSKRARQGRIFIDYLRNGRGATAVAAYSARARPGAMVSVPVTWAEVEAGIRADHFTIPAMRARFDGLKSDPWDKFRAHAKPIREVALRKLGVG